LLVAVVATQLFLIRRHRRDDYRAHFSVWRWVAVFALLASAEIGSGGLGEWVPLLAGTYLVPITALWCWSLIKLSIGTAIVVRLFFEMREHRLSAALLVGTWLGWGATVLLPLSMSAAWWAPVVASSSDLLASCGGLITLLFTARYIIRDAATGGRRRQRAVRQGADGDPAEPARRARRASKRQTAESTDREEEASVAESSSALKPATGAAVTAASSAARPASNEQRSGARIETPAAQPRTLPKPLSETAPKLAEVPDDAAEDDDDDDDSTADASMAGVSKAQRRKIAKLQRRQQRNAA